MAWEAERAQGCAECRRIEKRDRVGQALFACRGCGVVAHADRNASRVIARRDGTTGRESRVPAAP
ncbi:zinc ribbon domain-containing protein [Nocardiopsis sp. CNT312]|uniref:zinc ribbon domain-containing protein n=1 Tax=Nocardiopsis sp. CNT312 TaxID=1137268 RepID=UPI00351027E1